jgi:hypothetical protein
VVTTREISLPLGAIDPMDATDPPGYFDQQTESVGYVVRNGVPARRARIGGPPPGFRNIWS